MGALGAACYFLSCCGCCGCLHFWTPVLLKFGELILWFCLEVVDCLIGICSCPLHTVLRSFSLCAAREPVANRKTLVIVGGNFGGLAALHEVAHEPGLRVILIDQREYFEYTPGVLRLFCDPTLFLTMAQNSPSGDHEFMVGTVTHVGERRVTVSRASGDVEEVEFDYLVLATGADYRQPITPTPSDCTLTARSSTWCKEAARVKAANTVLILGGGAVGSELAAEIACHFPSKRVTIVDALPHLVPLFPKATIQHVERWLVDKGVELVLGQKIDRSDDRSCTMADGRVIEADLIYVCFGMRCNSQCVAEGELSKSLGPRKEVRVNEFLQLNGQPRVFAIGDVMAHPSGEIKQAYYAEMNGLAAGRNVLRHMRGQALLKYPDDIAGAPIMPLVYIVSLGRYDGSLGFNSVVINGPIAALMKWFIEWTKMRQMERRPVGQLVWHLCDAVTFFLSRYLMQPRAKGSD